MARVDDVIHDVTMLERVARVDDVSHDVTGLVWHVRTLAVVFGAWAEGRAVESLGGAWRRVLGLLGLKFLGFVNTRPFKTPVWSVL